MFQYYKTSMKNSVWANSSTKPMVKKLKITMSHTLQVHPVDTLYLKYIYIKVDPAMEAKR